jgi:hypothetical protein
MPDAATFSRPALMDGVVPQDRPLAFEEINPDV